MKVLVTCEHLSNSIPEAFLEYFKGAGQTLESHRGYDIGAAHIFGHLRPLADKSFSYPWSRLLIEPNRSTHHKNLFSEFTKGLPGPIKRKLKDEYYNPYRQQVEEWVRNNIQDGVLHISVHSFTPELHGVKRNADIGLLYDPSRQGEKRFATYWAGEISKSTPYKIRRNYPYLGKADGFTTYLRKTFGKGYRGIELEVNQRIAGTTICAEQLRESLKSALSNI